MNTNELQAGPELDALVAEKVMGWKIHNRNTAWWVDAERESGLIPSGGVRGLTCGTDRWSPSTNIKTAWEVVENVRGPQLFTLTASTNEPGWRAYFSGGAGWVQADTAPLAICRAALLAVGVEA